MPAFMSLVFAKFGVPAIMVMREVRIILRSHVPVVLVSMPATLMVLIRVTGMRPPKGWMGWVAVMGRTTVRVL